MLVLKRGIQLAAVALAALAAGAQDAPDAASEKQRLLEIGRTHANAWDLYQSLQEQAGGGQQSWLSSETVNNVRRVYTDGRDHPNEADRYPLYYGDSIGFWEDGKLVIHTNQLMARYMGRNSLYQSDAIETVEIWEKVAENRIEVDAWIYDPSILEEPWHSKVVYNRVPNPDHLLRVRYWHCGENPNNEVFRTEDGGTQFREFLFEE